MKIVLISLKAILIFYLCVFAYLNYSALDIVLFYSFEPVTAPVFLVLFLSFGAGLILSIVYISIGKIKLSVTEYRLKKIIKAKDKEIFSLKEQFLNTNSSRKEYGVMGNLDTEPATTSPYQSKAVSLESNPLIEEKSLSMELDSATAESSSHSGNLSDPQIAIGDDQGKSKSKPNNQNKRTNKTTKKPKSNS